MFEDHEQKPNPQQQNQSAEQEPSDIFRDVAQSADQEFEETPSQDTSYEQLPRQGNPHIILYIIIAILSVLVIALTVVLVFVKLKPTANTTDQDLGVKYIPMPTLQVQPLVSIPPKVTNTPFITPYQTPSPTPAFTPLATPSPTPFTSVSPSVDTGKDTDKDGLLDSEEEKLGTRVDLIDTDGDGLSDREEIKVYKTNPLNNDSDNDTYKDGEEIKNGYNPLGPGKLIQAPQ